MNPVTIISLGTLAFVFACRNDSETIELEGVYQYQGFDTAGTLIAYGQIDFLEFGSLLQGTKSILTVDSTLFTEAGEDSIHGERVEDDEFLLYLVQTPGPYLLLFGQADGDTLRGDRREGSATRIAPERIVGTFNAWRVIR